jgi:hypothetical protein
VLANLKKRFESCAQDWTAWLKQPDAWHRAAPAATPSN